MTCRITLCDADNLLEKKKNKSKNKKQPNTPPKRRIDNDLREFVLTAAVGIPHNNNNNIPKHSCSYQLT